MASTSSRPGRPVAPSGAVLLKRIKSLHEDAYKYIDKGLKADEEGRKEEALTLYGQGRGMIEQALSISCDHDEAKRLQDKMRKTKLQIEMRQNDILSSPPSYDESCVAANSKDLDTTDFAEATEVFHLAEGVQIFFITAQGYVSAPSYPASLHVYRFDESASRQPQAFLKVGSWIYPLQPGCSPSLETSYGAFLFPDIAGGEGSAVGLLLPSDLDSSQRKKFENLLNSLTELQIQTADVRSPQEANAPDEVSEHTGPTSNHAHTSTTIAKGLVSGAEKISYGLHKGAQLSRTIIQKGSTKLRERMTPEQKEFLCSDQYKEGIRKVRYATHCAVKVSSFIVSALGQATVAIGRQVAPHIKSTCKTYLPKSVTDKDEVDGRSKLDNVVEVAAGGLKGFSTVYLGLEEAAKSLLKSLAEETVQIVDHKYGKDAGHLTEHALFSVGNITMTGYNVKNLGLRAVVKRAAKDTGAALLEEESSMVDKTGDLEKKEMEQFNTK